MTTPQLAAIARIPAKPGQRDALITALEPLIAAVEAEEGTLRYILHTDVNEPDVLWFYEQYTDGEAFKAHGSSEAMKTLGPVIGEYAGGKVDIHIIAPVAGKGL